MPRTDHSALPALLERVRQATSADRDLFAAVLYRLGINAVWLAENSEADNADARLYERIMDMVDVGAFLDAALALCARVLPGWEIDLRICSDVSFAILTNGGDDDMDPFSGEAPTPALALLAALVAAEMEEKEPGRVIDALTPLPPDEEKLLDEYGPERTPEPKDA